MQLRLSPTSASRKLIALAFIKRYFAWFGQSPSHGEIAAALHINRTRARDIVRQLAADALIELKPGARGIVLIDGPAPVSEGDALRLLADLGWKLNPGEFVIDGPVPKTALPLPPALDHIPDVEIEGPDDTERN